MRAAFAIALLIGLGSPSALSWGAELFGDNESGGTHCSAPSETCDCAAQALAPPPDFGGCFWCRSKLTGDWYDRRTCAAESGVTYDFDHTYFYFGISDGGLEQQSDFGGHGDYVVTFDFGKMGVQEGLFLKLRAEHRFGETINGDTGALLPATISPNLPVGDSEDLYLTNVVITQALSENFAVFLGKMDTLDGDANAFAHGRGKTQFSNQAFVANPALLRFVPYSTLGAGFVVLREMQPLFTFTVLNATDTTRTSGFDELFEDGAVLNGELRWTTCLWGRPGHQLIGVAWSDRDLVSFDQDPRIILPNVPIARQTESWSFYWNFDQYLVTYSDAPTRGWGVFGRWGLGDDASNPVEWFLSFGVGGNSPLACREADTFGIGWYYVATSDRIGPVLQTVLGPIGDGQGVEFFYNIEVTPWCHITPDFQIIDPARQVADTAYVAGIRAKIDF